MVNYRFLIDSNTFWMISGTSKVKIWTRRPTNYCQNPSTNIRKMSWGPKMLGDFWVDSCVFKVLIGVYGVLFIPKWLKIDSWPIPILFGWFWELSNFSIFWTRSGPWNPVFLMNLFQKIQENMGTSLENMDFGYLRIWKSQIFGSLVYLTSRFFVLRTFVFVF